MGDVTTRGLSFGFILFCFLWGRERSCSFAGFVFFTTLMTGCKCCIRALSGREFALSFVAGIKTEMMRRGIQGQIRRHNI